MANKFDEWWEKPQSPKTFDEEAYNNFKRAVASRGSRPSIPNDAALETPEETAERGRAMFRRALMQADADDLQEDLRQMLEALGMSDHARPYSPHRVFQEALTEMKRQLGERSFLRSQLSIAAVMIDELKMSVARPVTITGNDSKGGAA